LQHRAGVVREHGVGGDADAFGVEKRGVREAAGEADDAGLAEQFEQLADGGGFYVFEAVGELQHGEGSVDESLAGSSDASQCARRVFAQKHNVISANSFYTKLRSIDSRAVVCDFLVLKSIKYEIGP